MDRLHVFPTQTADEIDGAVPAAVRRSKHGITVSTGFNGVALGNNTAHMSFGPYLTGGA